LLISLRGKRGGNGESENDRERFHRAPEWIISFNSQIPSAGRS
jgi:hypothetical protein